jgi:hypothetical protein
VTLDTRTSERPPVGREVLAYLAEHPDSHDTLEGIVEWWLLEREIKHQTTLVRAALAELVERGLVVEHCRADARSSYQINRARLAEIRELLAASEGTGRATEG